MYVFGIVHLVSITNEYVHCAVDYSLVYTTDGGNGLVCDSWLDITPDHTASRSVSESSDLPVRDFPCNI